MEERIFISKDVVFNEKGFHFKTRFQSDTHLATKNRLATRFQSDTLLATKNRLATSLQIFQTSLVPPTIPNTSGPPVTHQVPAINLSHVTLYPLTSS